MPHNGKTPQATATPSQADATPPRTNATSPRATATPSQANATPPGTNATSPRANATPSQADARLRQRGITYHGNASIERRLMDAQLTLDLVVSDAALQSAFARYGYDLARIQQGRALRDQALALLQQQRVRTCDQRSAIHARDAAYAQARAVYMRHIRLARVALRDDRGAVEALDLAAARKEEPAGWLLQAQQFYANALSDATILAKLAIYGLTGEQLTRGQEQLVTVASSIVAHQQRKAMKEEATQARDAVMQSLNRWMQDFIVIARLALTQAATDLR